MSKWQLNRKVLFHKGESVSEPTTKKTEKPQKSNEKKQPPITPATSKGLYNWLEIHDLINLNGLCKLAGYDRANFVNGKTAGKELKPEILAKMIDLLKPYGYAE